MREILFRGKRIEDGQWVCGGIVRAFHPNMGPDTYAICADGRDYFVEQNSIGQYTGLHDIYGEKIFEGDILDCIDRIVYVVWNEECGQWDCNFIAYHDFRFSNGIRNEDWPLRTKRIGNIHDNPELLEVAE